MSGPAITPRPIGWGILGAGRVAAGFAADLHRLADADLVAVASRRRSSAEALASAYGPARVHDDAAALVDDPEVDVVYVATPNHRHAEDALLCISHGKAVLCEKPFALNATEARQVVEAARSRGVFCMEAMWMRFIPAIERLVELLDRGEIGDVTGLHADFSVAASFDPADRLFDPAQGGGAMLDLGVYTLSLADLVLGSPTEMTAREIIGTSGVDEHAAVLSSYPGGRFAVLTTSLRTAGANSATVLGTEGSILLPGPICCPTRLIVRRHGAGAPPTEISKWRRAAGRAVPSRVTAAVCRAARALPGIGDGARIERLPKAGHGYTYEAEEVAARLRADQTESPRMPLDATLRIMEQLDAIRAQWTGHGTAP